MPFQTLAFSGCILPSALRVSVVCVDRGLQVCASLRTIKGETERRIEFKKQSGKQEFTLHDALFFSRSASADRAEPRGGEQE